MTALGSDKKLTTLLRFMWYGEYDSREGIHPLERGLVRIKARRDRRPGKPLEGRLGFSPSYAFEVARASANTLLHYARLRILLHKVWTDPKRYQYRDAAITPPGENEREELYATRSRA